VLVAADIISCVEFNRDGELLATGDKGGRVVIFQQDAAVNAVSCCHCAINLGFFCNFLSVVKNINACVLCRSIVGFLMLVAVHCVNCLGSTNPVQIFCLKVLRICSTLSVDDTYNSAVIHRGFPLDVINCGCYQGMGRL